MQAFRNVGRIHAEKNSAPNDFSNKSGKWILFATFFFSHLTTRCARVGEHEQGKWACIPYTVLISMLKNSRCNSLLHLMKREITVENFLFHSKNILMNSYWLVLPHSCCIYVSPYMSTKSKELAGRIVSCVSNCLGALEKLRRWNSLLYQRTSEKIFILLAILPLLPGW